MSSNSSALLVICISIAICATTLGSPILDDLFRGFLRDSQLANEHPKDSAIVKRRIYEENPDARLKQVSLQSLIGDVEDSLFQTALSVSSVANNNEAVVPEVKPSLQRTDDRAIIKRQTEEKSGAVAISDEKQKNAVFATTTESSTDAESKSIFLQTTQKVPAGNGVPAHVLIDRVAVQPHQGGLPIIPAFQVYHTKVISATFKEPSTGADGSNANGGSAGSTKISIAQTAVQATNAATIPVITIATTNQSGSPPTITTITEDKAATATAAAAPTTTLVQDVHHLTEKIPSTDTTIGSSSSDTITEKISLEPITTKLPIVKLKEAEEELKEKVAEIEAEPVILTARV